MKAFNILLKKLFGNWKQNQAFFIAPFRIIQLGIFCRKKNWKLFMERYAGSRDLAHLIEPMSVSTSVQRAKDIETFLKKHPAPSTERTVSQVLERIHSNAAWLTRDRIPLATFLGLLNDLKRQV